MALDYVKNLREMDATGGEVVRPTARRSNEDLLALEEATRQQEAENGRYGRFVDQQGQWATAWQAPGRMTPLVPPRFVLPATVRRNQTKELMLVPPEGEPILVEPQQWVVLYDGATEAIVADDEQFRQVMTREDRARARAQAAEAVQEPEEPIAQPTPVEQRSNAIPAAGPANMMPSISIDGFVAQVLQDNARLRFELEGARRWGNDQSMRAMSVENSLGDMRQDAGHWRTVAEQRQGRINWLEGKLAAAMGLPGGHFEDRDFEAFLADAGRIYREDLAKIQMAEERRTNGPANEVPHGGHSQTLTPAPEITPETQNHLKTEAAPAPENKRTRLSTPLRKEG